MPVRTWVDVVEQVRYIVFSGVVAEYDIALSYAMVADPTGEPTMDLIVDTTGIEGLDRITDALKSIALQRGADAKRDRPAPARVAIVAPSDAIFGMARMYEGYRESSGTSPYQVSRTMEEAREWLGLPPSSEP